VETGKNETVTTITIVDFEFNVKLDDNIFTFSENDYEDYYMNIID
jgi:outer membrane lipoprotein-sorting protein